MLLRLVKLNTKRLKTFEGGLQHLQKKAVLHKQFYEMIRGHDLMKVMLLLLNTEESWLPLLTC